MFCWIENTRILYLIIQYFLGEINRRSLIYFWVQEPSDGATIGLRTTAISGRWVSVSKTLDFAITTYTCGSLLSLIALVRDGID